MTPSPVANLTVGFQPVSQIKIASSKTPDSPFHDVISRVLEEGSPPKAGNSGLGNNATLTVFVLEAEWAAAGVGWAVGLTDAPIVTRTLSARMVTRTNIGPRHCSRHKVYWSTIQGQLKCNVQTITVNLVWHHCIITITLI